MNGWKRRWRAALAVGSAVVMLTACGGGGSDSAGSLLSFDVDAGLRSAVVTGSYTSFSASTDNGCTGAGSYSVGPALAGATFEGRPASSSTAVLSVSFTNCGPATTVTVIGYSDENHRPLGAAGARYIVYTGGFRVPSSARVGDSGVAGTGVIYADATKAVRTGSLQLSYVVEPDTADSAILAVVTREYDSLARLESTQYTRYRINSANSISLLSIRIEYARGGVVVLTRL